MPRLKVVAVIAGLSLMGSRADAQQIVDVQITSPQAPGQGAVTAFGYYMSPYGGKVNGITERLNCVDFFHDVTIGETWKAVMTNLGAAIAHPELLANTRDGSNGLFATPGGALSTYEMVAWLTDQFPKNPATKPDVSTAIQTAIWEIASNSITPLYSYTSTGDFWATGATNATHPTTFDASATNHDQGSSGYWIYQAGVQYSKYDQDYYSRFNILTDININDPHCVSHGQYVCTAQEFIFSNPEPGTLALMGTGLMGIVGVTLRRRRRSVSVDPSFDESASI